MNKKVLIGIIFAIIAIIITIVGVVIINNNNTKNNELSAMNGSENDNMLVGEKDEQNIRENTVRNETEENITKGGNKTLVVYYSAQNHTKAVAEKIAQNLNADIFEIEPEEKYSNEDLNWTNINSRVSKEHEDESLRDVKLKKDTVDNWNDYDTVLIGYPIWWGIAAWPVDTFVKANNFYEKTVIPFCTSSSSDIGQSGKLLEREANGGDWKNGQRFNERPSDSTIKKWTDSIKQ